jgi:hypothetical protein
VFSRAISGRPATAPRCAPSGGRRAKFEQVPFGRAPNDAPAPKTRTVSPALPRMSAVIQALSNALRLRSPARTGVAFSLAERPRARVDSLARAGLRPGTPGCAQATSKVIMARPSAARGETERRPRGPTGPRLNYCRRGPTKWQREPKERKPSSVIDLPTKKQGVGGPTSSSAIATTIRSRAYRGESS